METQEFKNLICSLEGFKTKFREFHWNAISLADHKLCDGIMDSITEYQDEIAEEGFTIFDKFEMNEFIPIPQTDISINQALNSLLDLILLTKTNIFDNIDLTGIITKLDEFIHIIRKYIYLSNFQ